MERLLFLLILFCTGLRASAQTVSGKVFDESKKPVPYANVVILSAGDSAFIAGTTTNDDGAFSIRNAAPGNILKASFVGYEPFSTVLSDQGTLTIVLKEDAQLMKEVVVKGNAPLHKMTAEGMQTNIENTVLSKLGTCEDVLSHIPGLIKKKDGYEVFGKGAPVIYINGRQMRDATELERLKSSDIRSVEVIANPGSRYDATVKAVVKIRTKRVRGDGFGFDVRSSYYQSENVDLVEQINWKYRHGRLELFGGHGYSLDNGSYPSKTTTIVYADTLWRQDFTQEATEKASRFKNTIGADYQLNDSNSIGMKYTVNFLHDSPAPFMLSSDVRANEAFYDHINTSAMRSKTHRPSQFLNFYYVGKFGKMDIDFNADYLYNKQRDHTVYQEDSRNKTSRTVTSDNQERNRLFASKLTLGYPVLGGSLSVGAEYTSTNRNDDYVNPEQYVPTSFAQLKESNIAPFMEYTHMLPVCQLTVGLRWEAVRFNYYENGRHIADQSRSFSNLFPSISAATKIGDLQMQLSYAAKTRRPSYRQLSNNVSYGNRFLMQSGNPLLQHEYIHTLSLGAMWKFIQLGVSYKDRRHAIVFWSEQDNHNSAVSRITYTNLPSIKSISAQLTFSPTIGIWTPEFSAAVQKQWLNLQTKVRTYKLNKPIWQLSFNNTFNFGKGWLLSMESYFVKKGNDEIGALASNTGSLDINLTKSFLKDRLAFRIGGTDLFHTRKEGGIGYTELMETIQVSTYDSRQLVLTVTYKFNASRSKYKGTGAGQAEKKRL